MYRKVSILIILKIILVSSADENLFCDKRFTVISDLEDKDCARLDHLVPLNKENDCIRVCYTVLGNQVPGCEDDVCPPGFRCETEYYTCEMDPDSCFKYYTEYEGNTENLLYKIAYWRPDCLKNGQWAPRQCKGEAANGRCFCYDEVGKRIFGQQFSTKNENMTCACSRDRIKMEKDPNNWFVSLHCDLEGNYEPLQCNMMDEMCWCADPQSGEVVSQIVPLTLWNYLPCYDSSTNGDNYLRQCESHLFAQRKLDRTLKAHGTMDANYPHVMCDPDGSYGIYIIQNGAATCVWRDKTVIGPPGASGADIEKMNCNCLRDSKILGSQQLQCDLYGGYVPNQTIGETIFCVDSDGFQNTIKPITKPEECKNII